MRKQFRPWVTGILGIGLGFAGTVWAQSPAPAWPAQPVRIVVPFSAGGPADLTARVVADEMGKQLGRTFIVDNRSGAGGVTGTAFVASAPKDGHTVLLTTTSLTYLKALGVKTTFDPEEDLVPVGLVGTTTSILIVNNDFPAKTLPEVIALVRANPGKYNYGSAGIGSAMHFSFERVLATAGGLQVTHVPYRGGGGTMMTDIMSGQVQMATDPASSTMPFLARNNVRAIAVMSGKRLSTLPNVPTFRESGLPEFKDFESIGWYMMLVPSGTPPAIVAKINEALRNAVQSPTVQKRFAEANLEVPANNTPENTARLLSNDIKSASELAKRLNLKAN
ncbi:Bug family tripartite tricarboxylate transporter substrate binding protein [Ottowia thiooxydans]|uniref:Bug family tripartite tricarboxylate transporter substrate binding protein n=1 Tax=Ottowia thiooxydans TaxID=219182 RepID=UPI0003FD238B|nr:tripartite tricarboxylate transporter substrate binding protein [Ottowia thiooxydans]